MTEDTPQPQPTMQVKLLSAEEWLAQAQEPELAAIIDSSIESIQTITGANDRQMLRAFSLLLRSIAVSMPRDSESGLDARRFHQQSKTSIPPWRDCIGAALHLQFDFNDQASQTTEPENSTSPHKDEDSDVGSEEA